MLKKQNKKLQIMSPSLTLPTQEIGWEKNQKNNNRILDTDNLFQNWDERFKFYIVFQTSNALTPSDSYSKLLPWILTNNKEKNLCI